MQSDIGTKSEASHDGDEDDLDKEKEGARTSEDYKLYQIFGPRRSGSKDESENYGASKDADGEDVAVLPRLGKNSKAMNLSDFRIFQKWFIFVK